MLTVRANLFFTPVLQVSEYMNFKINKVNITFIKLASNITYTVPEPKSHTDTEFESNNP